MPTTFERCPAAVKEMANAILCEFETHQPLLDARVTIDFVFAVPELDEHTGEPVGDAIKVGGIKALGMCRKVSLKERALGRADAEITLDKYWWEEATGPEQRALLDHELHHIAVKIDERGLVRDDIGRPVIQLRKHDVQIGWFKDIAARHPANTGERLQAAQIMCDYGQYFWPDLVRVRSAEELVGAIDQQLKTEPLSGQDEDEELVQQCIEVIRAEQKASVSLLQRRLRLGYSRAARIMDELESRGMVGPAKGAEPRDILIGELVKSEHAEREE